MSSKPPERRWRSEDGRLVFCTSFVHYITHKRVYRKDGGVFCFRVR